MGPNGSGKSNFLDALRFVVHSMHAPLEQVVAARSGMHSVLRKLPGALNAPSFTTTIDFALDDRTDGSWSVTCEEGRDGGVIIQREACRVGTTEYLATPNGVVYAGSQPGRTGDRPALVSFGALPDFASAFRLLSSFAFYAPSPERMRKPVTSGSGKVLSRDGDTPGGISCALK